MLTTRQSGAGLAAWALAGVVALQGACGSDSEPGQGGSGGSVSAGQGGTGGGPAGAGGGAGAPTAEPPSFNESPLVFLAGGPPESVGTYFITFDDPQPRRINGVSDDEPFLSPSRRLLLQNFGGVSVYEVAENGARVGNFPSPGGFLGWRGDSTLLFLTNGLAGVARMNVDGTGRHEVALPPWVAEHNNGLNGGGVGSSLSPDARAVALVAYTEPTPEAYPSAILVVDAETGAVAAEWPVPQSMAPGKAFWARDGKILYYSSSTNALLIGTLDPPSLSAPIELPFKPCDAQVWVESGTVLMGGVANFGDYSDCDDQWLVGTDGSNPRKWEGDRIHSVSADGAKILQHLGAGGYVIADPSGANPRPLPYARGESLFW